ncbi:MAG: ATP-grasp domain-containing protein [Methanobacterium sp.]|uniref:ATP-grasp domain-containing protein n=1 Tax=Methanobacterium sp. TaxID=2164 RepID=UPI003D6546E6|nr:ATP-grasp domain-containing protein [Methanobacterium sp.]
MNILIIEYATALGIDDPSISAEGHAMIKGLLKDFKNKNTDYLISKKIQNFNSSYCNPVELEEDLMEWINKNISNYDACLVIAPEEDFILYEITYLIEKKGVCIIGSSSNAVKVCSDKYVMYEALKDHVPIIKTEKVYFNDINKYIVFNNKKKVVKPADGVSCSGVQIINNSKELKKAASMLENNLPYFIIQDFVEGTSASVSLISNGKEAIPLSLNLQDIELTGDGINYNGGKVPLNHELADEAKEIAKKAAESINGLKGYVGVDMILGDEVHLVEINSRITTPYVALRDILDFNIGDAILDSIYGILPSKIQLNGEISFFKQNNTLNFKKLDINQK